MSHVLSTSTPPVEYRGIPGFPGYRAGTDGSVWSCVRPGINRNGSALTDRWKRLTPAVDRYGYKTVCLRAGAKRRQMKVHQLVLFAFVGPKPAGACACHADGDRSNNSLANLRWDSFGANVADMVRHGTSAVGERNTHAVLNADSVRAMRAEYATGGTSFGRIALKYGVTKRAARLAITGATWRHIA